MLSLIDSITQEYMANGFVLTARQLYYQLVSRGVIENKQANYQNITNTLKDGRMAGLIDWDSIEDRTRTVRSNQHWDSPQQILYAATDTYMVDRRASQPIYVEAWIEKDALIGVLEQVARMHDVPCFSCRGYPSASALRDAATRFIEKDGGVILYAGDHDPSGLDIPRYISDQLRIFGADVIVKRIALTDEQIRRFNPPPNPAKETDTRAAGYIAEHGKYSWELDALDPQVLADLYDKEIEALTDNDRYIEQLRREESERQKLIGICESLA